MLSSSSLPTLPAARSEVTPTPAIAATIDHAVLKLAHPAVLIGLTAAPLVEPEVLKAMQRLVSVIQQLRSTERGAIEQKAIGQKASVPTLTPETLELYVADEAYDLLESLEAAPPTIQPLPSGITPHSLIAIETLIPHWFWCIARSSYPIMQLIEGIRVKCAQANPHPQDPHLQDQWQIGMLRLIVMLEVTVQEQPYCFDLATRGAPVALLTEDVVVQSTENLLPTQSIAQQEQLLQQQIQASSPGLQPFLDGVAIEWLQPDRAWQPAQIRLRFGFEFVAQPSPPRLNEVGSLVVSPTPAFDQDFEQPSEPDPDAAVSPPTLLPAPHPPSSVPTILNATTLLRVSDQAVLDRYLQTALQPWLVSALSQLQPQSQPSENKQNSLGIGAIVQAGWAMAERVEGQVRPNLCFLQPELLMDELVPKLLWQITRSSYEVMRLVGGVEAEVLQPLQPWKRGTMRLVACLTCIHPSLGWSLDLATGHPPLDGVSLSPSAIVQAAATPFCQPLTQSAALVSQVLQVVRTSTPEIGFLLDGLPIEWLTDFDWQSGTLWLNLSLEFVPEDC